ncbi:MAG: carbohydrate binding domain-containing protein [Victivallales bacterium]|nr:carbohydrate binding domain-containing protein [Victivallales bacterium]
MKKLLIICVLFIGLVSLKASVAPGENLLINGIFNAEAIDQVTGLSPRYPDHWNPTGAVKYLNYSRTGGPNGMGAISFSATDGINGSEVTLRQQDITLVPGEKYRISAMVKTVDFNSPNCGITVYNQGWHGSSGMKKFPANQDWTRMSADFNLVSSKDNWYGVVLYACNFTGTLEIADVKLEAISEAALKLSKASDLVQRLAMPMLVPWKPLLNNIPLNHNGQPPEMTFRFFGKLPQDAHAEDYEVRYSTNDSPAATVPLVNTGIVLPLKDIKAPGDFPLTVAIVDKKTGNAIYERTHSATAIVLPETTDKGHRRLNNLVVEILNAPLAKTTDAQTFDFCTMRSGWIFIAAQDAAADSLEIMLDGKLVVINSQTPRLENFRDVLIGGHTLEIKGAVNGGRIVVRSIPEIFNYCPGINNGVPENPPFDWEFQKRYVLPAVTTQNGGNIPQEHRKEFFDAGYKWIANLGTVNVKADELVRRLDTCAGMNNPAYQGVSCDEQFFNQVSSIMPYTDGMKKFVPKNDHVIYTWITNQPSVVGLHNDFIAECLNACHGRGRLISEVYCRTKRTLKNAQEYLDNNIIERTKAYKRFYPNIIDHWGIILGNFNQIPILSLAHHPNVDYKYYLDMQFNLLANNPECKDMAITGYWGSYYADHELHRWAFMLTRHYCVEGKTTMLSDEYGFSYAPGHIKNGDFDNGFDHWTTSGNVTNGKHTGFASNSHNRWGGNGGAGDTFAVFTKEEDEVSTVTQVAKGFVPGKAYCLQFSTVDYNDVKASRLNPRQFGINVTLDDGAQIRKDLSWLHIDKRVKGRYAHNNGVARCNLHHIVFIATKPEITVTFDNAKALKGEALGLNYVMLNPFLLEK